jgi:hypothetical protein
MLNKTLYKSIIISCIGIFPNLCALVTRSQLLDGLKEESQIEDNGKREGVGARSLTRSTRGVEGRARAPGLN